MVGPPSANIFAKMSAVFETIRERARAQPVNVVATLIFLLAVIHTFFTPFFAKWSKKLHAQSEGANGASGGGASEGSGERKFLAELLHFLGEPEAVFGAWVVPLLIALSVFKGWPAARDYMTKQLDFTEPVFVIVIMAIAASRPVLELAEKLMAVGARVGKGSAAAWWCSILTIGPVLGSLITEPAAMTISALLLANRFYAFKPSPSLAYGTLGLLFVNISLGGTLTHFAAPPVLMVATKWGWGLSHMLLNFGWKAFASIVLANLVYWLWFRKELGRLGKADPSADRRKHPTPLWVTAVHIFFLGWTVFFSHYPVLFIGGFLFYLAFMQATEHHQDELVLRPALMVGFFLAGLVVHGGLQAWWLAPVLEGLHEKPLFFGALGLTAINDNAAITYLASLVPDLTESLKYSVVAGAIVGGGLTVIANAPNPAGQAILAKFFSDTVSAGRLLLAAVPATIIAAAIFLFFR